jgi:SAM-dependent methyltransferase
MGWGAMTAAAWRQCRLRSMDTPSGDKAFSGAIAQLYETHLVPLIFEPYARDLARRVVSRSPGRVLEVGAGTGVVTRALSSTLPPTTTLMATDLNQPMLDLAAAIGTNRPVTWQQADALRLPFAGASFEVVVCQFSVMFFPDKAAAFAEAHRVLAPGGAFIFNVWDRIEENEFAHAVTQALEPLFPGDPPRFLARVPHGYHDLQVVARDLAMSGFHTTPEITTVAARSRAGSPAIPAIAYCQGTPLRNEIEARDPAGLEQATAAATAEVARRFGTGAVDGKIQAHVVTVER